MLRQHLLAELFACPGNRRKGRGTGENLRWDVPPLRPTLPGQGTILKTTEGVTGLRIYLDLAVLLNTAVDFLLLMGTNSLAGFSSDWKRNLAAATLGGLYGGICLLSEFRFLGGIFWRLVFLGLMGAVAFGWNRGSLKRIGTFVLLSMAMGGIALGFGRSQFLTVILAGASVWLLCRIAFGGRIGGKEYVSVRIRLGERQVKVLALRDTGNSLRDPVTGEPVLVLGADAAVTLTGLTRQQLSSPLETMAQRALPGLRLIPYRAVGSSCGMLLAMRFEDVTIGDKRQGTLVAFDPGGLGTEQMYQALTGGV